MSSSTRTEDINTTETGETSGIQWAIGTNGAGAWVAYARVPEGHKWYGKDYDDVPAEVHGGLTYSETYPDGHWIGFDFAHIGDYVPGLSGTGRKWTQAEVAEEAQSLAQQVADAA